MEKLTPEQLPAIRLVRQHVGREEIRTMAGVIDQRAAVSQQPARS